MVFALLLKQFALSVREITDNCVFTVPGYPYQLGRVSQQILQDGLHTSPIHIDEIIWNEDENNEAVMILFQPLPGAKMGELNNGLLQLQSLPQWRPSQIYPEEVHITPFSKWYLLPKFVNYEGYTSSLKHIRRFKRQCRITTNNMSFS